MRLKAVTVENFRCYVQPTRVEFDDLTMLVGQNDSGKSAVLEALAVFFDEATLDSDDLSLAAAHNEIRITCEFDELPQELVLDSSAGTSLTAEWLLNRSRRLEIRRTFNGALAVPKPSSTVAVAVHPTADGCSDLLQLKNAELKERAHALEVDLAGVDLKRNPEIRAAIWKASGDLKLNQVDVALDDANAKAIWKALSARLPSFALFKSDRASTDQDAEAQDPLKTAIKEAIASQKVELDALASHVEVEVKRVADATVARLREMDASLASELSPQFRKPNWASVFKVSLTDEAQVPINKRGSGVRRLILLNFLRAKAEATAAEDSRPEIIYALEEPETSLHPDKQRLLLSALQDIAAVPGNQILLTSHTPVLARQLPDTALRYIAVNEDGSRTVHGSGSETNRRIAAALGVLPDHDVRLFLGVEGKHDIEFLKRIAAVLVQAGEDVPSLSAAEAAGHLVFIPLGGSNLALWVARLQGLEIPEVHIFDRDASEGETPKYEDVADAMNKSPNATAIITGQLEMENYVHADAIEAARPDIVPLPALGRFVDVPATLAQHIHDAGGSPTAWSDLSNESRKKKEGRVKQWLNRDAVDRMTPDLLSQVDPDDDVRSWLREVAKSLT